MKPNDLIIYIMILLLTAGAGRLRGQERKEAEPQKLDFLVTVQKSDSVTKDKSPVFDLRIEIRNAEIRRPAAMDVKVISAEPREVYFIRSVDREVLIGRTDVRTWERAQLEKEKRRAALRMEKNKTRKEKDKLWEGPRYEKQEGRSLEKIEIKEGKPALVFGPFSPGDYQVYVKVRDGKGTAWLDRHNITISPEVEESEEQEPKPGLIDLRN